MADIVGVEPVMRSSFSLLIRQIRGTTREGNIPINIFLRIHRFCHTPLVLGTDMLAQWKLDEDPADSFVYVELRDLRYYLIR